MVLDTGDAGPWQTWAQERGWLVVTPPAAANGNIDQRVQAVAAAVAAAVKDGGADPAHIYLGGRGDAAAMVFYTISRVPDLWAAGLAFGGSPKPAIDTDRVFMANFSNTPVLWVSNGPQDEPLAKLLKSGGLNLEWRNAAQTSIGTALDWLAGHKREEFPREIDCETTSPTFASCYWIRLTKFDPAERNDVLPSSKIQANPVPVLGLGAFGYKPDDPGPGLLISFLPEKYEGPLKVGDRIVAIDGRDIADVKGYQQLLARYTETKQVALMIQRGKDRNRIDSFVSIPRRDPVASARVEAQYLPDDKEIQIVSRTITEMRVTVPAHWVPSKLFWNGLSLEKVGEPGCWALKIEKELLRAARCE